MDKEETVVAALLEHEDDLLSSVLSKNPSLQEDLQEFLSFFGISSSVCKRMNIDWRLVESSLLRETEREKAKEFVKLLSGKGEKKGKDLLLAIEEVLERKHEELKKERRGKKRQLDAKSATGRRWGDLHDRERDLLISELGKAKIVEQFCIELGIWSSEVEPSLDEGEGEGKKAKKAEVAIRRRNLPISELANALKRCGREDLAEKMGWKNEITEGVVSSTSSSGSQPIPSSSSSSFSSPSPSGPGSQISSSSSVSQTSGTPQVAPLVFGPQRRAVIICALAMEANAMRAVLSTAFKLSFSDGAKISGPSGKIFFNSRLVWQGVEIIVIAQNNPGSDDTQDVANAVLSTFGNTTKVLAMTGICAAKEGEASLGDVIFPDKISSYLEDAKQLSDTEYQYNITTYDQDSQALSFVRNKLLDEDDKEAQEWREWIGLPRPPPSDLIRNLVLRECDSVSSYDPTWKNFQKLSDDLAKEVKMKEQLVWNAVESSILQLQAQGYLNKDDLSVTKKGKDHLVELARKRYTFKVSGEEPKIVCDTLACGPMVQKNWPAVQKDLKQHGLRKVVAIERETVGIVRFQTAHHCHCIVLKGVSDYGDVWKDDLCHEYAARASAAVLCKVMKHLLGDSE